MHFKTILETAEPNKLRTCGVFKYKSRIATSCRSRIEIYIHSAASHLRESCSHSTPANELTKTTSPCMCTHARTHARTHAHSSRREPFEVRDKCCSQSQMVDQSDQHTCMHASRTTRMHA